MAREVLGVHGITSSWGLTEFPVATYPSPDAPIEVLDHTTGPTVAGVEVRTVGAADGKAPRPAKKVSCACVVRSASSATWMHRSTPTRSTPTAGSAPATWACFDADGNVSVTGRIKDIIIRNAENISALEVEEALYRHPAVVDVAVVAAPDARTGERVCAFVVPTPGATLSLTALAEHCRSLGLAVQKCPEQLELVDSLPRNSFGKVLKQDLRHASPDCSPRDQPTSLRSSRNSSSTRSPSWQRRRTVEPTPEHALVERERRPRQGSRRRHRARPAPATCDRAGDGAGVVGEVLLLATQEHRRGIDRGAVRLDALAQHGEARRQGDERRPQRLVVALVDGCSR